MFCILHEEKRRTALIQKSALVCETGAYLTKPPEFSSNLAIFCLLPLVLYLLIAYLPTPVYYYYYFFFGGGGEGIYEHGVCQVKEKKEKKHSREITFKVLLLDLVLPLLTLIVLAHKIRLMVID